MNKRLPRAASLRCFVESLENRVFLCGSPVATAVDTATPAAQHSVVAAAVRKAPTKTTLAVSAGTLDQPVTFDVMVRANAAAGSPVGSVNILNHGVVIDTIASLAPTTGANPRFAFSEGSVTLTFPPGGSALFFGSHTVTAAFIPAGTFLRSSGSRAFKVTKPAYTITGGIGIFTTAAGSGPAVQTGQTANLLYTGYFARNGRIFDDSINDGASTFPLTLGVSQVITGFSEGALGMQVGETRMVLIPPAEGYGPHAYNGIPGNSTLIFVLTLESIS